MPASKEDLEVARIIWDIANRAYTEFATVGQARDLTCRDGLIMCALLFNQIMTAQSIMGFEHDLATKVTELSGLCFLQAAGIKFARDN